MSQRICSPSPSVSIVIPARNEARRLPRSLRQIAVYHRWGKIEIAEVIVVDNGSSDRTADIVRKFKKSCPRLPLRLATELTPGKGAAVRTGMLLATGDLLFQCDADLSMPIEELEKLVSAVHLTGDVAVGCREGQGGNRQGESHFRQLIGRFFNLMVRTLELSALPDTQCGFKLFRREVARELFSSQTIMGWGFDVEILVLARQHGYSVASVPIRWEHNTDSRIRPIHDGLAMMHEIWAIRKRWKSGVYGSMINPVFRVRKRNVLEAATHGKKFAEPLRLSRAG